MRNTLLTKSLSGERTCQPPIWLMRQAGRYMKEYRDLKEKYSFLELCRNPDLATEVTMQPIKRFSPDAAILFSDILITFEGLGLDVEFNPGPMVANPIVVSDPKATLHEVGRIRPEVGPAVEFVPQIIKNLKGELPAETGLIGFSGAPWTLTCYAVDQKPYKHYQKTSILAKSCPEAYSSLTEKIVESTASYLNAQIQAGVDAVQIFDSWVGVLSAGEFATYVKPGLESLLEKLDPCPRIYYAGSNSSHLLGEISSLNFDAFGLDSKISLPAAAQKLPSYKCLQGNLDPTDLFRPKEEVAQIASEICQQSKELPGGFIFNLSSGILQHTPVETVETLCETVKNFVTTHPR